MKAKNMNHRAHRDFSLSTERTKLRRTQRYFCGRHISPCTVFLGFVFLEILIFSVSSVFDAAFSRLFLT